MAYLVTMAAIKRNYATFIGGHWFDASTMRFFNSKLAQSGYRSEDGGKYYFVTSERAPSMPGRLGTWIHYSREYTVRVMDIAKGTIGTLGEFQEYATRAHANRAMIKAAEGR